MISEKVRNKLKGKSWTFQELSDINNVIVSLANELYDDLETKSKMDLIWNVEVYSEVLFGEFFQEKVLEQLSNKIAEVIKIELQTANVNFNKDSDINEVPKRSVGRKPLKKRPTNEESNSKK